MDQPESKDPKKNPEPAPGSLDRREFLAATGGLLAACAAWNPAAGSSPGNAPTPAGLEVVETLICTLRLNSGNGNLIGLTWKDPALEVIQEPRLGENFRLLFPRADYEANYFTSSQQAVSRFEKTADGVTCYYDSLRNDRETIEVKVRYHLHARRDHLEFSIEIENPTGIPLAEVFFAIVGGQQGLVKRHDTESLVPGINVNLMPGLFTNFRGGSYGGGNLGIRYDSAAFTYPGAMPMGWLEFFNRAANLGLYYGNHDPENRLSGVCFELRPYTKSAVLGDNWPLASEVPEGEPIGLTMGWLKFPYLKQGLFRSGPVALRVHRGDWHDGSEIYRSWFDQHFPIQRPPSWLRKEMAWQSVIISNCEDVVVWKFKDLPRLAAGAKKYGVATFEILGWDVGGIDRGYPQYQPDPRLGTTEEFRQALAEVKRLGVHPLIFANVQFSDTGIPLFDAKLRRDAPRGRWAEDLPLWGWGEGTISARMGLTRHNMTLLSPGQPEFRRLLLEQLVQLARDGAEGFQLDKTNVLSVLDFNPQLPTSPDKSFTQELLSTFELILRRCREINPQFALASEIWWDRSFQYVDVSYTRMGEFDMDPALRYTFPEWVPTICAERPGDFNVMNNGMRYGMVWAVQPRHYNDSMDERLTQPLSRYVQELIRIRSKHQDILFFGRFRDMLDAQVTAGANVRYSVFESMDKRRKACVLVNFGNDEAAAELSLPGEEGRKIEILKPFHPDATGTMPAKVTLPPRTCAVIVAV